MSDPQEWLKAAQDLLAPWAKQLQTPEPNRLDVWIEPGDLLPLLTALRAAHWGYLAAITGMDLSTTAPAPKPSSARRKTADAPAPEPPPAPVQRGDFEVLYHVCEGAAIVTLRVRVPRDSAVVPSVCALLPNASVFERELSEMFGVTVAGTPDPGRLFLPEDWPEGVYPLRKDFK